MTIRWSSCVLPIKVVDDDDDDDNDDDNNNNNIPRFSLPLVIVFLTFRLIGFVVDSIESLHPLVRPSRGLLHFSYHPIQYSSHYFLSYLFPSLASTTSKRDQPVILALVGCYPPLQSFRPSPLSLCCHYCYSTLRGSIVDKELALFEISDPAIRTSESVVAITSSCVRRGC